MLKTHSAFLPALLFSLFTFNGCGGTSTPPVLLRTGATTTTDELNQLFVKIRAGQGGSYPGSHTIATVPKSKQINQLFCVIASTEMMLNYWDLGRGRQLELAREYSKANPDTQGRKKLATLADNELKDADWNQLNTNYVGLIRYLNRSLGDRGKVYNWEYAGEGIPERHLQALKTLVSRNIPVLVAARTRTARGGHCMLMVGYTPTTITVINPTHGKRQRYSNQAFMQSFQSLRCEWVSFVPEKQ